MDKKNSEIFLAERRPKAVVEARLEAEMPFDYAVAPLRAK